jgi:proton-dependent oligopeptide transporter, POT family
VGGAIESNLHEKFASVYSGPYSPTKAQSMKHPKALRYFFLTEMWERFGFYILSSILILYLTSQLDFTDSASYAILGEFTALAYIVPVLGGYLANNVLGYRVAILAGALLLFAGYAALAISASALLIGLTLVIVGNGFLKPNISSFLGEFYGPNDPKREAGFTLFYIGINIGGITAPLVAGLVRDWLGSPACFAIASVGLLIAVITFRMSFRCMADKGFAPKQTKKNTPMIKALLQPQLLLLLAIAIVCIRILLAYPAFTNKLLMVFGLVILCWLLYLSFKSHGDDRRHMIVLIVLIAASIVFWGLLFQIFFTVNLFVDRAVDRVVFGKHIPTSAFISLEAIFIISLGPLLAKLWEKTHKLAKFSSSPFKFSYAMLALGIGMQLLVVAIHFSNGAGFVSPIWLVAFFFILTSGEMLLSPIGLAMVTELSPPRYTGIMMGIWFTALGYGGELSGFLAEKASIPEGLTDVHQLSHVYQASFQNSANLGYITFIILFCIAPILNKLIRPRKH